MRGELRVTAGITGGGRWFSLVIFILSVWNGPLLGLALHLVTSPAGQAVHHLHGVVGRALQDEPDNMLSLQVSLQLMAHFIFQPSWPLFSSDVVVG